MKEVFGIESTMRNAQTTGRSRRTRPSRIATMKVKRGPAKGKTAKVSVYASISVTMMSILKRRTEGKHQVLTPEELTRRQIQLQRDSYRFSSAMNSGDL